MPHITSICDMWIGVLLRESLYATVVFVVVLGLTVFLRRRNPFLHLALWTMVLLRLVLPLDLGHPLSLRALVSIVGGFDIGAEEIGGIGSDLSDNPRISALDSKLVVGSPSEEMWPVFICAVWCAGALGFFGSYLRRRRAFYRIVLEATPVTDREVIEMVEHSRRSFAVRRRVRTLSSAEKVAPFTTGIIRPVIYLPSSVVVGEVPLEMVIAHEMAHVARWDCLWLHVEHLLRIVYFFNPVAWIVPSFLDQERERVCDAMVLSRGMVTPQRYARGLLNVLLLNLQGVEAPTLISHKRRIQMRFQDILESRQLRPRMAAPLATVFFLGAFLLPMHDSPAVAVPADSSNSSSASIKIEESASSKVTIIELTDPLPDARITRGWGEGNDPFTGKVILHRGIDLAAKNGTAVRAAAAGIVEVATTHFEKEPGAGTVVLLRHDGGFSTFYSHLGSLKVAEGQEVAEGEAIATVGSTGKSTGPHLHFEIRKDGEAENPADYLDVWR